MRRPSAPRDDDAPRPLPCCSALPKARDGRIHGGECSDSIVRRSTASRSARRRYTGRMNAPAAPPADTPGTPSPPSPFRSPPDLDALNALSSGTAIEALGIVFTAIGPDWVQARMPVDTRTRQPYGLLHGGASVLLAETLGSSAGNLCVGEHERCVGIEINANHLVAVREGEVVGTARPLHIGRRTQVWDIRIEDALGRLACISRLTLAVIGAR